jgi:hypothetical protein
MISHRTLSAIVLYALVPGSISAGELPTLNLVSPRPGDRIRSSSQMGVAADP